MSTSPSTRINAGRYPWLPGLVVSMSCAVTFSVTPTGTINSSRTIVPPIVLLPLIPWSSPKVKNPALPE